MKKKIIVTVQEKERKKLLTVRSIEWYDTLLSVQSWRKKLEMQNFLKSEKKIKKKSEN